MNDGVLSYRRSDFRELFEILPDAFSVRPAIMRSEAISLFSRALRECRKEGELTPDALMVRARALQHGDNAVPMRRFTMWTKFRASGMAHAPGFRLEWQGIQIRSAWDLPAWLTRDEYFLNGVGRIFPRQPYHYGHIILSCEERVEERAVDRLMDALQLVQGLANLYETAGRFSLVGDSKWTDGPLWLGPYQFVFDRRTFRGEDQLWHNPDYNEDAWNRHPPQMTRILQVIPHVRRALAALEDHPFRHVLLRATMLLQDGFSSRDGNHRLLRYWSTLEQLYGEADVRARSSGKVVDRAMFAEIEPALARWKLEHIVRLRNDYVHAGGSDDDLQALGQFLRRMVARHIIYWTFNGTEFADHEALLAYLRLPNDRKTLESLRGQIDRRLAILDQTPSTDRND